MKKNVISRRKFLGKTTAGIGLGLVGQSTSVSAASPKSARDIEKLRRGVKVASVDLQHLYPEKSAEARMKKILSRMEKAAAFQPDIICLPETFNTSFVSERRPRREIAEDENTPGPVTSRIGEFARKHNCYVICPIVTKNEGKYYNSAIILDRVGKISGVFHKTRPVSTEIREGKGIIPGPVRPPVFKTDFGKIGVQICFDANWFESWEYLKDDGAEIVFFPSQFPGGRMLNFHAWKNNYYVVSSTGEDARIIDISGIDIDSSSFQLGYTWAAINLEKEYIPTFPGKFRIPDIYKKYGEAVKFKVYRDTGGGAGTGAGHITIESLDPDIKVRDILEEFKIPTYREELEADGKIQKKYRL
ncbi:carbon-nitrogen hydrolase family protein [candidate division KSB1 bacterium]